MSDQSITVQLNMLRLSALTSDQVTQLWLTASEKRRLRAERFARPKDALRCLAGEALLRYALRQCELDDTLAPQISGQGKPNVPIEDFHYNLSHGGDWVVFAYSKRELGVDVEPVCRNSRVEAIARKHFTPYEQKLLLESPVTPEELSLRFTLLWTRKESYVKYTGQGLACALPTFSVDLTLPRGRVLDMTNRPILAVIESFTPDAMHIVSVCGQFDVLRVDTVAEELFKKR